MSRILDVINRLQSPTLNLCESILSSSNTFSIFLTESYWNFAAHFLKSKLLADFCKEHNGEEISSLHASFANMDRFAALIKKQTLLHYPEGREVQGVIREYNLNHAHSESRYIQRIYADQDDIMILCFYDAQAEILLDQVSFEVDMSFKRIKTKGLNEVVLAAYMVEHGKGASNQ